MAAVTSFYLGCRTRKEVAEMNPVIQYIKAKEELQKVNKELAMTARLMLKPRLSTLIKLKELQTLIRLLEEGKQ